MVDGTLEGTGAIGGDATNGLDVDVTRVSGTVTVDGSGVTQPVSGTVTANAGTGTFTVDGSGVTQPVSGTITANAGTGDYLSVTGHTRNEGFKESNAVGGELDDTTPVAATEGNVSPVRITAQRAFHANLRNNAGTEIGTTSNPVIVTDDGSAILVDGSAVTQPVSGTITANAGTGTFTVDGSGVTQPVSGTITANAGTGTFTVDGSGVTQPVSGTITANAGTGDFLSVSAHTRNEAFKESTAIGGELDDAATTAATEGNVSPARITAQRAVHTNLRDNAGTEVGTAGAPIRIDPTGSTTQPVSGTITANAGTGTFPGTEYTEDAAAAADPVGTQPVMVRADTPATVTDTDGDVVAQRATNYGAAYCQIITSSGSFVDSFGGSGGTSQADESTFTEGTTNMTPIGGVLNDTIASDPTEDQAAAIRITAKRAMHTNLRDNAGTEVGTAGAPIRTDPTGSTTQPVSGTVTANAGTGTFTVDGSGVTQPVSGTVTANAGTGDFLSVSAHTRNEAFKESTAIGGELDDTTPVAATEGNVSPARITAQRALHANLRNNAGTEIATASNPVRTDPVGTTAQPVSQATASSLNAQVVGNVASGAGDSGNPVKVGAIFNTTQPTVTTGQRVNLQATNRGALIIATGVDTPASNQTQVGGTAVSTGNGTAGAGVQRVTIASDNTAFAVNATLQASTNTTEVVGDVAHDIPAAGNPVLIAGISQDMDDTAPPNQVSAESDAVRMAMDRSGAIFSHPHGPRIWSYHENSSSALTDAQVKAAPGAGLSLYVTDIVVSTGAATAFNIFFEEGATTVLGPYYLEAVNGRGFSVHFQTPKKITANTALTVTTSAAIAHGIDVTGFTAQG